MPSLVRAKTLFDNVSRQYRITSDLSLRRGMLILGTTCFGNDIVEIGCPKTTQVSAEEWDVLFGKGDSQDKSFYFSFEPQILRLAKDSEIEQHQENMQHALKYKDIFKKKIEEYNLDMKIVRLYYPLTKDKLVCVYTANKRVDFRLLVKDLGSALKQRIELYQISIRDAFGFIGGCGTCGSELCCALGFDIPGDNRSGSRHSKCLGVCGKTKCCVFYESD